MSNRSKVFVGIVGFLAIATAGSLFVRSQKARKDTRPPAEKVATGADSRQSAGDPQRQVNYLIKMGDKMMDDGDFGSARSYYQEALKLAPSNTVARAGIDSANQAQEEDSKRNPEN